MICAPTDAQAKEWAEDMLWFWENWSTPFGQGLPKLLIGSPDTISREIEEANQTFKVNDWFGLIPQGLHDRKQILTSLELFATKVMPRFS
jgi:alkanesulfonate monooxygenase SsuD/methylene tetrahydromethanopterin reductase-like flavin-dependent oxidoreductase (luciferase family)